MQSKKIVRHLAIALSLTLGASAHAQLLGGGGGLGGAVGGMIGGSGSFGGRMSQMTPMGGSGALQEAPRQLGRLRGGIDAHGAADASGNARAATERTLPGRTHGQASGGGSGELVTALARGRTAEPGPAAGGQGGMLAGAAGGMGAGLQGEGSASGSVDLQGAAAVEQARSLAGNARAAAATARGAAVAGAQGAAGLAGSLAGKASSMPVPASIRASAALSAGASASGNAGTD